MTSNQEMELAILKGKDNEKVNKLQKRGKA